MSLFSLRVLVGLGLIINIIALYKLFFLVLKKNTKHESLIKDRFDSIQHLLMRKMSSMEHFLDKFSTRFDRFFDKKESKGVSKKDNNKS